MDSSSQTATMQVPLLSADHQHEKDQVVVDVAVPVATSEPVVEDDDDELEESDCVERIIGWLVLPAFLFIQFGIAFSMHDPSTQCLSWSSVSVGIVLFCISSYLYRRACKLLNFTWSTVILAPEILMNVILALVLFGHSQTAFEAVMLGAPCLTLSTIWMTFWDLSEDERVANKGEKVPVMQV